MPSPEPISQTSIDFTNNGMMTVTATSTGSSAEAYSMDALGAQNTVLTNGVGATLSATANSTDSSADAYGMSADAERGHRSPDSALDSTQQTSIDIINNGTLTIKAEATNGRAGAYGISAMGAQNTVLTNGVGAMISVSANTYDAIAYDASPEAYGMRAWGDLSNSLSNKGTLTVKAESTNTSANAYGLDAGGAQNTVLTNGVGATITVSANGTDSYIDASGMSAMGDSMIMGSSMENPMDTDSAPDSAPQTSIDLTNSGTINVNAEGKVTDASLPSQTNASGMVASKDNRGMGGSMEPAAPQPNPASQTSISLMNNGEINVSAKGDEAIATGMAAFNGTTMSLTNEGTINVDAIATGTDTFAHAAGMYIEGGDADVATINNLGVINATASGAEASAYQAYIASGTANVDTWAITLGESYGEDMGYYVFGVENGATLNFGLDGKGAKLIVTSLLRDGFEPGVEYKISDMIENNDGTVTGYIESVTSPLTFVDLELVDAGTANDYTDQSIKGSTNITSNNSPAQLAASQAMMTIQGHMSNLSKIVGSQRVTFGGHHFGTHNGQEIEAQSDTAMMYADAGTTFTDAGGSYVTPESPLWKAFLMPFYSTTSAHGGTYDTDMGGLVVGANRSVGENFVFGFHASVSKADSSSAYTNSDAISYALGVNGVYNVDESLYVRGQLSGFFAENDLDMSSSTGALAQKAFADMDTYGMYAELAAGYDIALAPTHVLTPELSLSYVYAHMEGFDSAFIGAGTSTSFSMNSENYNALYADASVRWTGTYDLGNKENGSSLGQLKPTVKAGIRQALTDPEVSSTMNIFGSSATTHADANETAFTCEAGLVWDMGDVNTSLTYTGEFGDVENSHMGMFKVEWEF